MALRGQTWFARVLRDGTSLAVTNKYAPFREIGALHLRQLLSEKAAGRQDSSGGGAGAGPAAQGPHGDFSQAAAAILEGFNEVEPHEDVPAGFQGIVKAGYWVSLSRSPGTAVIL